jgi:uncharacterized repeat protein (TIGR01451 family)
MNPLSKHRFVRPLLAGLALSLSILGAAQTAQAEGSRTLYPVSAPAGNFRANLEWRTETYGGIVLRRTLLKVFANAGENILVGSSAMGIANGATSGDILIFNPNVVTGSIGSENVVAANASFKCSSQAGKGLITSRAQELAGPNTITGAGNPTGYTPCFYTAPTTGIYDVVMYGPSGFSASGDGAVGGDIGLTDGNNFNNNQKSNVAAWDVTVRGSATASTADLNGRLFSNYYALFTGSNGRPITFPIYPVTNDGFRYKTQLRGLDPNGFLIYGNQVGFFDSDGKTPLYHDIIGQDGQISSPSGSVSLARPQYATFVNQLDPAVLPYINTFDPFGVSSGTGITTSPVLPVVISPPVFTGSVAGNTSLISSGGTFAFSSSTPGNFQIVISRDGVDYDPTNANNRVLRGVMAAAGAQSIAWNGKDNSGVAMPAGNNYPVKLVVQGGEYHFPLLDAENNFSGGPTFTLLNTSLAGKTIAFYDDRGYKTIGGTTVGTIGSALCGIGPPTTLFSDPINGFDTTTNQRAYGQNGGGNTNTACSGSFGDTKGLDSWTYSPSASASTTVNIVASAMLGVAKAAGTVVNNNNGTYTVPFTVTVQNYGAEALKNVQVTEDLLAAFSPIGATDISTSAPVVAVTTAGTGTPVTSLTSAGAAFTGKGGVPNNLLAGGAASTLATGAKATITFNVTFKPGLNTTTFNNSVVATGTSVLSNTNVTDTSNNGLDPDNTPGGGITNNDNNPTNNTTPTPVNYANLGVAKTVVSSTKKANGSYDIAYSIKAKNYGSESLTGVQVTDDLLSTFSPIAAGNITLVTAPAVTINTPGTAVPATAATALTANAAFTGIGTAANTGGVNNLLSGTNVLAKGADATITFTLNVNPGLNTGTYQNTAKGISGGGLSGGSANDDSQDGTDPDSTTGGPAANNGDNNPGNNTVPTPVTFSPVPNLRLVKRVSAINVKQPNGTFVNNPITTFNDLLTGLGADDDNAAGWPVTPPVYLQGVFDQIQIPAAIQPKPGDEVEYTIYYLSDGKTNAQSVSLCDFVPNNSTYVTGTLQQQIGTSPIGTVPDALGLGYYTTAPFPPACTGTSNGNGAVLVNVGNVPNSTGAGAPATSYGFIRFRAKVN